MKMDSYSARMSEGQSYITITLDLRDPVEINDFAAMFAGVGAQFEDYLKKHHPDLKGTAKLYVREVRHGSIVAYLFPNIPDLVGFMDSTLIVLGFGALFSKRLRNLISGNFIKDASKSDIKEIGETIRAVSNDANGTMQIESVTYENNQETTKLEIKFNAFEGRQAVETLNAQKRELDAIEHVDYQRVLMVFERSAKSGKDIGRSTGELVVIDQVSEKPKALIYASESAEQIIKTEIRDAPDNVYKKGFVVDANVRKSGTRVVAYAVTHVHQVIDLPDDN